MADNDRAFEEIVRNATLAADAVAVGWQGTAAARTRAIVERALDMLIANGQVEITDPATWPTWTQLDKTRQTG